MSTRKFVAKTPASSLEPEYPARRDSQLAGRTGWRWSGALALCTLAFLVCILLTVTPLIRMPDSLLRLHIAWGSWLGEASRWLPANLGTTYQSSSPSIEFFGLLTLAFLCYCLAALLVSRWPEQIPWTSARVCIWSGLILAGAIYVVTPGLLSHDIFVYAGYSRLMAVYHANPYFVPFSDFSRDPLVPVDQWSHVNAVYGPIWLLVCSTLGPLLKPTPESYVVAFRLFALAIQLLNIWLVDRVLRALGRSQRTRTAGMLLYAWNPLVLLESTLNGHNDVFLLTFILLGILLVARAEQRGELLRARGYLPPIVALTLAVLVKFALLPVVAVYLLFLVCKALKLSAGDWKQRLSTWRVAARLLCWSCLASLLVALAFYAPFWFGHSSRAIIDSFANNPASAYGENSLLRSVVNWLNIHPEQQHNPVLLFLSLRRVWDSINYLAIALFLLLSARLLWKTPTVGVLVTLMLALMSLVLLLTPWFFTWYVTWIMGLAVVSLPARRNRAMWSCFMLALTFSYSALSLYLFNQNLLGPDGYLVSFFDVVPPICVFLFCWFRYPRSRQSVKTVD